MKLHALKVFYENEVEREAVKDFMLQCLNEMALDRVFKKESTISIADAKELVDLMFIRLKEEYGDQPAPNISSSR